jgi:hypothetical protein
MGDGKTNDFVLNGSQHFINYNGSSSVLDSI